MNRGSRPGCTPRAPRESKTPAQGNGVAATAAPSAPAPDQRVSGHGRRQEVRTNRPVVLLVVPAEPAPLQRRRYRVSARIMQQAVGALLDPARPGRRSSPARPGPQEGALLADAASGVSRSPRHAGQLVGSAGAPSGLFGPALPRVAPCIADGAHAGRGVRGRDPRPEADPRHRARFGAHRAWTASRTHRRHCRRRQCDLRDARKLSRQQGRQRRPLATRRVGRIRGASTKTSATCSPGEARGERAPQEGRADGEASDPGLDVPFDAPGAQLDALLRRGPHGHGGTR